MIESYDFGQIVIDGKRYTSDVIVFPERVKANWWRKEGHKLCLDDIKEVIEEKPEIFIVGTGYMGLMKILPETEERIKSLGIKLIVQKTREACETFNSFKRRGKKVVAALHLTC